MAKALMMIILGCIATSIGWSKIVVAADMGVMEIINQLTPSATRGPLGPWKCDREIAKTRGVCVVDGGKPVTAPNVDVRIHFDFGSHALPRRAISKLDQLGRALVSRQLAPYAFLLVGHTDSVGSEEVNEMLSHRRARSVKHYLLGNFDIGDERLDTMGRGEQELADPANPTGAVNRRVRIMNLGRAR